MQLFKADLLGCFVGVAQGVGQARAGGGNAQHATAVGHKLPDEENVTVYHSGTAITEDGQLVTNGGRVLGVTATAPGLPRAISIAYEAAEHIHFDKLHKRTDIGMRALKALAEKE